LRSLSYRESATIGVIDIGVLGVTTNVIVIKTSGGHQ